MYGKHLLSKCESLGLSGDTGSNRFIPLLPRAHQEYRNERHPSSRCLTRIVRDHSLALVSPACISDPRNPRGKGCIYDFGRSPELEELKLALCLVRHFFGTPRARSLRHFECVGTRLYTVMFWQRKVVFFQTQNISNMTSVVMWWVLV